MPAEWALKQMRQDYLNRIPYGLRQQMGITEATIAAGMTPMPAPMLVGSAPGNEDAGGMGIPTSPGGSDNHVHVAVIDAAGNGSTQMAGNPSHSHIVRSFVVAPWQDVTGQYAHDHPGQLNRTGQSSYYDMPSYMGAVK